MTDATELSRALSVAHAALREIETHAAPFAHDRLTTAENTITDLRAVATKALRANANGERFTNDEIRAINQAAAHLDGVLYLDTDRRQELARSLFAIAGNPMSAV